HYDLDTKRLQVEFRELASDKVLQVSVRLYNLAELTQMMETAGLEVEAAYGDVTGTPFGQGHSQLIVLARRR
ncbi:MAG: hypothetical protein J7M26_08525, partial [Armatimonadetes bacterium]|nr:hypothetical protein [Armatimonadota bacterium]